MPARGWTISVLLALGAASAVVYVAGRGSDKTPPPLAQLEVGGQRLTLPSAYLAFPAGEAPQMAAYLPDFRPAGSAADVTAKTDLDARFLQLLYLRPVPADPSLDPAERTARLYERFLSLVASPAPDGLTARAFSDDSPFRGDELLYAPPEGREFAARCRRDDVGQTASRCVSVFRTGGLDVELRFARQWMPQWREILRGAQALIDAWRG